MLRRAPAHVTVLLLLVLAVVLLAGACSGDDADANAGDSSGPATASVTTDGADATSAPPGGTSDGGATSIPPDAVARADVELLTADGETLTAAEFGEGGTTGVVLGHMRGSAKEAWFPMAERLAAEGVVALAIDFRGYGGSTGERDTGLDIDYAAAVDYLRTQGATDIVLVGASMGGTGAIVAAADPDVGVDRVVSVSGPAQFGDLDAEAAAADLAVPVLFIAAADDEPYASDAQALAAAAGAGPDAIVVVDGSAHGTDIFAAGDDAARTATDALLAFVIP